MDSFAKMVAFYEGKKVQMQPGIQRDQQTLAGLTCDRLINEKAELTVLHFYGGAYCMRMPNMEMPALVQFCANINADAYMPWYGLAPEHKFPQAPQDCLAAYEALLEQGIDPSRIVLSGISAGGGNVLSVLALLKQKQLPMPICAVLISPTGDALMTTGAYRENALRDPMFRLEDILYFNDLVLTPEQRADPLLNVTLMDSFDGYPPMYLTASSAEILRDISVLAYEKAQAAGVPAQLDISSGGLHCMPMMMFSNQSPAIWSRTENFVKSHAGVTSAR